MFKKRGQGLSITVIVAAVIGLIILVVIIAMLTGKLGNLSRGADVAGGDATKTCGSFGGALYETGACPADKSPIASKDSIEKGVLCCK